MLIYSKTSVTFIKRLMGYTKDIFREELNMEFYRKRFKYKQWRVPLQIVVFEKQGTLGYFEHHTYRIGINKSLMYTSKNYVLKNIIRHEIAHLLCFLEHRADCKDHGIEYRQMCRSFGWGKEVSSAKLDLNLANNILEGDLKAEALISKIKKLLALSTSNNLHEAELATLKANQLLIKYNLSLTADLDDEEFVVERVLEAKQISAKLRTIANILRSFLVETVFNYGQGVVFLEAIGKRTNIDIGHYIAQFLERELERLWKLAQKENPKLKGKTCKNSFMLGISKGYKDKVKQERSNLSNNDKKGLIRIEGDIRRGLSIVYKSLSSSYTSSQRHCSKSEGVGRDMGKQLNIHGAVSTKKSGEVYLLDT